MTHSDASNLRVLLREALASRLEPAGWRRVGDERNRPMRLAAFVRPARGGFAASVEFMCGFSVPDRPPVRISQPRFGVSYEPLRRLWPLLAEDAPVAALFLDFGDVPEYARVCAEQISSQQEVAAAADRLAELATAVAIPFAERNSSLEALLRVHGAREPVGRMLPALLAAAGHFESAHEALSHYYGDNDAPDSARSRRRFVYQLTRWIDSGGDLALLPSSPLQSHHQPSAEQPLTRAVGTARALHQAVRTVKQNATGAEREQLRTMLEAQLSQRGLRGEPLWIEQQIDELLRSPAERATERHEALRLAARFGLTIARAIRERELPKLPNMRIPESAEPPASAVYAIPQSKMTGHEWTAVELDDDAHGWLSQVHAELPRLTAVSQTAALEVWLDWPAFDRVGQLAASVGDQRVGRLDRDSTSAYTPALEAAAERAELACAKARLTPLSEDRGYLLEAAIPAPINPLSKKPTT